jgi:hypothetical protein
LDDLMLVPTRTDVGLADRHETVTTLLPRAGSATGSRRGSAPWDRGPDHAGNAVAAIVPTWPERLMRVGEVATALGVDITTLQRWHARHAGPPTAHSTDPALTYPCAAFEAWCERLGAPAA